MNSIIKQMLLKYKIENEKDKTNAIKEIMQEIVLSGLYKGGFFNKAAFYGGTALRIFYDLDRFSEDLDFILLNKDDSFNFSKYYSYIENEAKALGINVEIFEKSKKEETTVKSAFIKGKTKELMLYFYDESKSLNRNELTKVKVEIDTKVIDGIETETIAKQLPYPYFARVCKKSTLFAGKIAACLNRGWKERVKGRDFYDYSFYLSIGTRVNLKYLKNKLVSSGFIEESFDLSLNSLKELLYKKFDEVDFESAKEDCKNFIEDSKKINIWCSDYFKSITRDLKEE